MQTTHQRPIELGTTVYSSDGQRVGDVAEIQPDFFVIEKGFIFTKDMYIPMARIASHDVDGIRLGMTKDEVEHHDWSTPPPVRAGNQDPVVDDRPESREETLDDEGVPRR